MHLRALGLVGWDDLEPVILAAIASGLPIMFSGDTGSGKTQGAKAIAKGLFGSDVRYAAYYCPNLHPDHLTGPVDVPKLQQGEYAFLRHGITLWDKDVVLLDEPSRAPQMLQAALMEYVRTRKWLGQPTAAKLVMSAMNPPDIDPTTVYLARPMAERFIWVWPPTIEDFLPNATSADPDAAAEVRFHDALWSPLGEDDTGAGGLAPVLESRDVSLKDLLDPTVVSQAIREVATRLLREHQVHWTVRHAQHLRRMLEGMYRMFVFDQSLNYINPENLGRLVHATCPEFYGAVPYQQGLSGSAIIPQAFCDTFGRILYPIFERCGRITVNIKDLARGGMVAADKLDWSHNMLDALSHASKKQLHGVGELLQQLRSDTIPEDCRRTVINRYRLRRTALKHPNYPLRLKALATILRRQRRPKHRRARSGPVWEISEGTALETLRREWGRIQRSQGFVFLPEDIEEGSSPSEILRKVRRSNAAGIQHQTSALFELVSSSNSAQVTLVFIDPSFSDENERVLVVEYIRGQGGRVLAPRITYVDWASYAQAGLACLPAHIDGAPRRAVFNPSWGHSEAYALANALSHGMEASTALPDTPDQLP